jgi:hypothetical protein
VSNSDKVYTHRCQITWINARKVEDMSDNKSGVWSAMRCGVEHDEIVIRIGLGTLRQAAEHCPLLYDHDKKPDLPYVKVIDQNELARDVVRAMMHEEEDGSTPLSDLFDKSIVDAWDDGSIAFEHDDIHF